MYKRAAILIQRGNPNADRQADVCAPYCLQERLAIQTIVPSWSPEQAVRLVRDGLVDVVVVAFEGAGLGDLVGDVTEAGGEVIAVHPEPRVLQPAPRKRASLVSEWIARWYRKGKTVPEIAALMESDTAAIRSVLLQFGFDTTRK